jgi:Flp pilus assembly protein TadG
MNMDGIIRLRPSDRCYRSSERGQVIVIVALFMVVLLGAAGLVIDVGRAYYVQRALQASTDAAALAAASELPDASAARAAGQEYGGAAGAKNARFNVPGVRTTVTAKCVAVSPCNPVNAVVVEQVANVQTLFARVVGIDEFDVHARATACSPCSSRPLDVMLVLDRTGSMCMTHSGTSDPSCSDLNNAREGLKAFLRAMDPTLDYVGLAVFPPARNLSSRCSTPTSSSNYAYDLASAPYVIAGLSSDYKSGNNLNASSQLVSTIECVRGAGSTSYATAIEKAQGELDAHGRADVQDIIVFFSDGAANYGPSYYGNSSPYRRQPCHQGISSAGTVKSRGTIIYSIGYDLNALDGGANICESYTGANESPAITAYAALQAIASSPETFYNQPGPGDVDQIYAAIAGDLTGSRLLE